MNQRDRSRLKLGSTYERVLLRHGRGALKTRYQEHVGFPTTDPGRTQVGGNALLGTACTPLCAELERPGEMVRSAL